MKDDGPKLGVPIPADERRRDAVHVAVAPMTAVEELAPGDWVRFARAGDVEFAARSFPTDENAVGVVDPFLTDTVGVGDRFWLFLLPGTVTGLRHVWTHPAFTRQLQAPKES